MSSHDGVGRFDMEGVVSGCVSLNSDEFIPIMYAKFPKRGEVFE